MEVLSRDLKALSAALCKCCPKKEPPPAQDWSEEAPNAGEMWGPTHKAKLTSPSLFSPPIFSPALAPLT